MSDGHKIFETQNSNDPNDPFVFQMSMGKELVADAPDIFMRFLSNLQSVTPMAKCLESELPELSQFYERMKHLRGEVPEHKVFHEDDLTNKIFSKLVFFNVFFKKCEKKRLQKSKKTK